ncbi:hypothetical protein PFLUV_G00216010 [Perca fluviatilis]|uniref:Uncharacterized protein n=1 Tax=Perca fluviatilis TaxID=8168 RepID=A0A6A5ELT6_PERFL|nr:hypothetical protein PFLUV_G00216010 [Perca fluviatilis]
MKFITLFLVLSLVVLMAEPGECIWGMLLNGALHVGKAIHGLLTKAPTAAEQQELDQLVFDRERAFA